IYNVGELDNINFNRETRLQVATVQSMYRRIFSGENPPPKVTSYDLIIVDEAHRGYTLDRETPDDEDFVLNQRDYQSKYRQVIDYFLAVRIALTATPALHTTEIFGAPVFKYGYRAVS
ncbi:DEAD/DEAH box helicase family protein, partial [Acinetobacter baumannii]|uniref:DEAD/DEAH box helicase family protein n=1 Tax=Acinetobacter baumannii TaxID=470 RepID=UPI000D51882C